MVGANPVPTPMAATTSFSLYDGSPFSSITEYRQVIGNLQYLSLICPDITFCVSKLAQFMHAQSNDH